MNSFLCLGISIITWVIILKQLFASGSWILVNIPLDFVSGNIHQYSLRLRRIIVNCVLESIFNGFLLKMLLRSLSVYILKQWIALMAPARLARQTPDILCYLPPSNERENGVRFASVTSKEIIQINCLWCILSHCFSILRGSVNIHC